MHAVHRVIGSAGVAILCATFAGLPRAAPATISAAPGPTRVQQLVHMVRQDCGSCHGMQLTGGLGPPLTRDALSGASVETLAATIFHGRPGTPMPGWRAMLDESEARWIAERLLAGFPEESPRAQR